MRAGSLVEIFRSQTCGKWNAYWFADHKETSQRKYSTGWQYWYYRAVTDTNGPS